MLDTEVLRDLIYPLAALGLLWLAVRQLWPPTKDADARHDYERDERAQMPREIADGRLVISEKTFYRRGNRPFAAKTDQGFLTRTGVIVLVESKTRARITSSDLVQLSAQAIAATADARVRQPVASWGYVRLAPAGRKPYYQRVELLQPAQIDQLWDRWHALKSRRAAPVYRADPSRCRSCVLRARCPEAELPARR